MGKDYHSFVDTCTLQCTTCLSSQRMQRKAWRDSVDQSYLDYLETWTYFTQTYRDQTLHSSSHYLQSCTYLIQDPHLMKNGVRRKMMKIPPPSVQYGTRESRGDIAGGIQRGNAGSGDNPGGIQRGNTSSGDIAGGIQRRGTEKYKLNTVDIQNSQRLTSEINQNAILQSPTQDTPNLHTVLHLPLKRPSYTCLNISTYDSKWGNISVCADQIIFYQNTKPDSVQGIH